MVPVIVVFKSNSSSIIPVPIEFNRSGEKHTPTNTWPYISFADAALKLYLIFFSQFILPSSKLGATIKDTRTKSRGRVEVGEGGGTGWGGGMGRKCRQL